MRRALPLFLAVLLAGCAGGPEPTAPTAPMAPSPPPATPPSPGTPPPAPPSPLSELQLRADSVLDGLRSPVFLGHAGDGSGRWFVVEQEGLIRVAHGGVLQPEPFLDLRDIVGSGGERGLLGLAFDPGFAENGRFYVHYTDKAGDTVLARYTAPSAADRADPASARVLLTQDQPYGNHNGGMLAFGPDGYLYLALGDGGSAGDPQGNAQNTNSLLGKLLRLDVSGDDSAIPPDNPFVHGGGRAEVWAYGLRNPWRFSFDRETGDLWIGDVGQNAYEEIDFQAAGSTGGQNYGWNLFEGNHRFRTFATAPATVGPVHEYAREGGHCSVTGGYVYRGSAIGGLQGAYLFGDYCSGQVWGLRPDGSAWRSTRLLDHEGRLSSFGEDEEGELYLVDHGGAVLRVVAG